MKTNPVYYSFTIFHLKNAFGVLLIFLFSLPITAQEKPTIFIEDFQYTTLKAPCYCKPGVRNKSRSKGLEISYSVVGNSTFEPETENFNKPFTNSKRLEEFTLKVKAPIILKPKMKLLLGYNYIPEVYRFNQIGTDFQDVFQRLDGRRLKSNAFSLYLIKPINDKYYTSFRLRSTFNGDYNRWVSFNKDFAIHTLMGFFGVKKDEGREWGIGFIATTGFRKTQALPFVLYNRTYNDRWGLEAVLPAYIHGRLNIGNENILLFGVEYNSSSFALKYDDNITLEETLYTMNHTEVRAMVKIERKIVPWVWLHLKAGYQYNFNTEFDAKTTNTESFQAEPTDAPFLKIGIFVSPPKRLLDDRSSRQ